MKTYQRPHAAGLGLTAGTAGDLASHLYRRKFFTQPREKTGYPTVYILEEFLVFDTALYTVKKG